MKRKASWCRSCLYFYLLFFCISSTRADTWPSMNSSFSFFLACIFCSLQMRSTSTALLGSSSVLTLCSFWLCGKICTLSPLEASYDACEANDIALSRASFRKPVVSIQVASIRTQAVKMHKNFFHLKYSFRVNKKNILCKYSSFLNRRAWISLHLDWINLYRNGRSSFRPSAIFPIQDSGFK